MKKYQDTELIQRFFKEYVYVKNCCAEVRVFGAAVNYKTNRVIRAEKNKIVTGWFTDADELVCELQRLDSVSAYMTVNPVTISRRPIEAKNKLQNYRKDFCCNDQDILVFRYLIIDIDPPRIGNTNVNSTDKELASCIDLRNQIIDEVGLSHCSLTGTSGNGAFILVHLSDCEMGEIQNQKVEGFLKYISDKYKGNPCSVDTNTKNPSRHLPIPGTWKYRDLVSTNERPHRQVTIDFPEPGKTNDRPIRSDGMDGGSARSTSF